MGVSHVGFFVLLQLFFQSRYFASFFFVFTFYNVFFFLLALGFAAG